MPGFIRVNVTLLLAALLLTSCVAARSQAAPPASPHATSRLLSLLPYVNPLVGTSGDGNVFPGAAAPFGMVQWSPDTSAGGLTRPGGYAYGDRIITGFSLTHLSGAGCAAFGNLSFMPAVRPFRSPPWPNGSPYSDRFSHAGERASPGSYAVRLASGTAVRLTVTPRTGFGEFAFPRGAHDTVVLNVGAGAGGHTNIDGAIDASVRVVGDRGVEGWVKAGRFCNLGNTYTLYFAAGFDRPFSSVTAWRGRSLLPAARAVIGPRSGVALGFAASDRPVRVKVGLSYVSVGGARLNLGKESPGWSFENVRSRVRSDWNGLLNRVQAWGGPPADLHVFYTALYHALLHPNVFSDVDGRYIGFDGRVHTAAGRVRYANFSGWDIYRSQIPLLAWLLPRETGDMMQSLVADAAEMGRLPKWPVANAETGEMNGDSADPILAGAYAFGARNFDVGAALRDMVKGATRPRATPGGYRERPGLRHYLRLGYIPGYNPDEIRPYGAAATTLEYALDDYAIAQLAHSLKDGTHERLFLRRSRTWRRLFDRATGLIEPRMGDGFFPTTFSRTSMDGYTEGNALQYTWMVPQDLGTLVRWLGGTRAAVARLDPLFTRLNGGPTDPYDWAGNEPGFGLPWVYDFAGAPWRTQAVVRRVMTNRYTTTVGGLPGNDDLGALSTWEVWAALGLYPEIPGAAGLAIGSPLFPHVLLRSEDGRTLRIEAPGAGGSRVYVRSLLLDGRPYSRTWLPLSPLRRSSTLRFTLGSHPNTHWGT